MSPFGDLSAALSQLVQSGYPIYLGHVHELLKTCGRQSSQRWASQNVDDLPHLAAAVIEQTELGLPFAIQTLASLAETIAIRDVFLEQSESLLNDLLAVALSTRSNAVEAQEACIAMLSHPIPPSMPLPAAAGPFLICMFERLVKERTLKSAQSVYRVSHGVGPALFNVVDRSQINHFCAIVRKKLTVVDKVKETDDFLPTCFGILGVIQRSAKTSNTTKGSANGDESTNLFIGQEGRRAAYCAIMQSTYSLMPNAQLHHDAAINRATLVASYVNDIDHVVVREALEKAAPLVPKLVEKAAASHVIPLVRLKATIVATKAAKATNNESSKLEHVCATCLDEAFNSEDLGEREPADLRLIIEYLASKEPSKLEGTISQLMTTLSNAHIHITTRLLDNARMVARALDSLLPNPSVQRILVACLASHKSALESLAQDSSQVDKSSANVSFRFCVLSLLLKALLSNDQAPAIPHTLRLDLLKQYEALMHAASREKAHAMFPRRRTMPAFPADKTLERTSIDSRQWSRLVSAKLDRGAQETKDELMTMFASACEEMESRCRNIERPLREEEERHEDTKKNLVSAREHVSTLEQRLKDRDEQVEHQRFETGQLSADLAHANGEADKLLDRIGRLQRDLEERQASSRAAEKEHCEEQARLVAEHQASRAKLTEQVEMQQVEINDRAVRAGQLEAAVQDRDVTLREQQSRLADSETTINRLTQRVDELHSSIEGLETRLNEAREQLVDQQEHARQDLERLSQHHKQRLAQVNEEASIAHASLQEELEERDSKLQAQEASHTAQIGSLQMTLRELKREVKASARSLEHERAERKTVSEQYEALRRLFSGFQEQAQGFQERAQAVDSDPIGEDPDMTEDFDFEQRAQLPASHDFSTSFSSSSGRNEPSPKRVKPRQSVRLDQPRGQASHHAVTDSPPKPQRASREPLRETATNRFSRKSLPAARQQSGGTSPIKSSMKHRTRKSIAFPTPFNAPTRQAASSRGDKENAYVSTEDMPFSTINTVDLDNTTEDF